ncbi:MAG: hypothetical protein ISS33_00600 [Candidatus Omnitrophica bacterium]|nr:hypothetical protein [Candidatus Omnitrophota bacterium]
MWWKKKKSKRYAEEVFDLFPSLEFAVKKNRLSLDLLQVGFPMNNEKMLAIQDRRCVILESEGRTGKWYIDSLRGMFRGSKAPPSMERYPEEYVPLFFTIESNALSVADSIGDITDDEFERIYSAIRRRPDGRSIGDMHDVVYQLAAFVLGTRSLSQLEFEAVFGQLTRSVRGWKEGPVSRNYVDYLRNSFS